MTTSVSVDLYKLATLVAFELGQARPGPQRAALRERFDRMIDMELRCAAENLAASDDTVRRLLDAIDYGTEEQ